MPRFTKKHAKQEADLDITSFMNLMIVLVPVLLLNMVFSHTAILDIKLPASASSEQQPEEQEENKRVEVIVRDTHLTLNYPIGMFMARFEKIDGKHDFEGLSKKLQDLKQSFIANDIEKKDILILFEQDEDYQTIVTTMDTVRSYKAVIVTDVVNAELFPDISLGDAPKLKGEAE